MDETTRAGRMLDVLNKIDRLPEDRRITLRNEVARRNGDTVCVSAVTGEGIPDLIAAIDKLLSADHRIVTLLVDYADGEIAAWLHSHGDIIERVDDETGSRITVGLNPGTLARAEKRFGDRFQRLD